MERQACNRVLNSEAKEYGHLYSSVGPFFLINLIIIYVTSIVLLM